MLYIMLIKMYYVVIIIRPNVSNLYTIWQWVPFWIQSVMFSRFRVNIFETKKIIFILNFMKKKKMNQKPISILLKETIEVSSPDWATLKKFKRYALASYRFIFSPLVWIVDGREWRAQYNTFDIYKLGSWAFLFVSLWVCIMVFR